ncbi:hypothetical protein Lal_00043818 [Lupinus albus]|nr:hypothetical protein Lal_00043818 [Lupinus albus]
MVFSLTLGCVSSVAPQKSFISLHLLQPPSLLFHLQSTPIGGKSRNPRGVAARSERGEKKGQDISHSCTKTGGRFTSTRDRGDPTIHHLAEPVWRNFKVGNPHIYEQNFSFPHDMEAQGTIQFMELKGQVYLLLGNSMLILDIRMENLVYDLWQFV